jgi:hypothetical protein
MTQFTDLFKVAEKTHRLIFESYDKAARLQLTFAGDLLDLNRKRFDALYADDTLLNKVSAQQDLVTKFGKRTATWAGDLRGNISDAANELVSPVAAKAPAAKAKKAKAA